MAPAEGCFGGPRWGLRGKGALGGKGTNHSLSENYLWKVDTNFRPLIKLTDGEGETGGGGRRRWRKSRMEREREIREARRA